MLTNVQTMVDAENNGQTWISTWRKTPNVATGAGIWFDLAQSPGNPMPMYYDGVPRTSQGLYRSVNSGIDHGAAVSPSRKYLKMVMAMTTTAAAVPLPMILCDYQMFYTGIELSNLVTQTFTNSISLPRASSVINNTQMMLVITGVGGGAAAQFYVNYTNSLGVPNRTTPIITTGAQTVLGTIMETSTATAKTAGPFLPLQYGDVGVQSVQSLTVLVADTAVAALVLCAPIENIAIRAIDGPTERVPIVDYPDLPVIQDDAYLNFICCPNGSLSAAPIHGYIQTIWG